MLYFFILSVSPIYRPSKWLEPDPHSGIRNDFKCVCVLQRLRRYYIPVRHDMMRPTNDCSPVRVMQHEVKYFSLRKY